jgi:hypothetical protein
MRQLPKVEPVFVPRLLPERSFLFYSYPQLSGKKNIEFYLPMLENITVREQQTPRLGQINLLGRSGNLFTFQGANSRSFDVKFSFNLDHIAHYVHEVGLPEINFFDEPTRPQFNKFKNKTEFKLSYSQEAIRRAREFLNDTYLKNFSPTDNIKGLEDEKRRDLGNIIINQLITGREQTIFEDINSRIINARDTSVRSYYKVTSRQHLAVNYLILFLNVIRTSVIGNSSNTSLGPPTIYLNHGTMYNNIPCVCNKYSIDLKNDSTYDLASLTPKMLEINLTLLENRTGDFGNFVPFKHIQGENLAGWECVIKDGTMDPYNYNNKT